MNGLGKYANSLEATETSHHVDALLTDDEEDEIEIEEEEVSFLPRIQREKAEESP
jgi:hypothetical protein